MKKIIAGIFVVLSLTVVAEEEFVIGKEVTGVNKETLEAGQYKNANVNLQKKEVVVKASEISSENLKNQKQVIKISQEQDELKQSLQNTEKSSLWKYILGAVALVVLGVAI